MPSISKLEYRSIQENFSCLNDLLALIRLGSSVIQSESDMYDLTLSALSRLSSSNIVYAEPSLNIGLLMNPLVSPDKIIKSITAASSQVETLYNIKINWLLEFSRFRDIQAQISIVNSISLYKDYFIGIGLAENEYDNPSRNLEGLFQLARNLGFCGLDGKNATAHTGEETPPQYIIETLEYLKVSRIDHGIRAIEDVELMKKLGNEKFPIAMAPISNKKLMILDRFFEGRYIYPEFIDYGCSVSINSDDPGPLDKNLNDNFIDFYQNFNGENKDQVLVQLIKNGFTSSFLSQSEKSHWSLEIDRKYKDLIDNL